MLATINLKGKISSEQSNVDLVNLTIELHDQNQRVNGAIISTQTTSNGEFEFTLNPYSLKRQFEGLIPEVFFVIKKGERTLWSTLDREVFELKQNIRDIKIVLPKRVIALLRPQRRPLPRINITTLVKASGVKDDNVDSVKKKLQRADLSDLKTILSSPEKLTPQRTGMDKKALEHFKAITKFIAASNSTSLSTKLLKINKNFPSLSALGAMSKSAIEAHIGRLNQNEQRALDFLYPQVLSIYNTLQDRTAYKRRLASRDGHWRSESSPSSVSPANECGCLGCNNVFSPYAYMLNLIDMIERHWQLSVEDLEKVLLQDIHSLDCESSQKTFLQIELAIEILEKSGRTQFPLNDSKFELEVIDVWWKLLFKNISSSDFRAPQSDSRGSFEALSNETGASRRLKNFISVLLDPSGGLIKIKKTYSELNSSTKIRDLQRKSKRYKEGGEKFEVALKKAYQDILQIYREAFIKNTQERTGKTVNDLQRELFIDLKAGSCKQSNRQTILILALQSFVLSARTGKLNQFSRPGISGQLRNKIRSSASIPVEEASWKWLKDYTSWASAMYVFLYPENIALPFLKEDLHPGFIAERETILSAPNSDQDSIKKAYLEMLGAVVGEGFVALTEFTGNRILINSPISTILYEQLKPYLQHIHENSPLDIWLSSVESLVGFLNPEATLEEISLEKNLYFPLLAAWALNRSENYAAAHDWYRQLYDPTRSGSDRFRFDFQGNFTGEIVLGDAWDEGGLDPEDIATRRKDVMLRHVILMMAKNVLDWADHEFALATPSSLDRARQLYELAQDVLDSPDLSNSCLESLQELSIDIVTKYGLNRDQIAEASLQIARLNEIRSASIINAATDRIRKNFENSNRTSNDDLLKEIDKTVKASLVEYRRNQSTKTISEYRLESNRALNIIEDEIFAEQPDLLTTLYPRTENSEDTTIQDNLFVPYLNTTSFCVPPNPVLVALDTYIKLALHKFQFCLDINSEPIPTTTIGDESVAEFFDAVAAEVEWQPLGNLPANWFNQPPRYRYSYLVEKARQYTDIAQRIGSLLLSTHEKYDDAALSILQAQHAVELASSTVDLRNLNLRDANTGLDLANLQRKKARTQLTFWQERINDGMLSENEQKGHDLMGWSAGFSVASSLVQGAAAIATVVSAGLTGSSAGGLIGSLINLGGGTTTGAAGGGALGSIVGAIVSVGLPGTGAALGTFGGALSTYASQALTLASFERRFEDWEFQRDLSESDIDIAEVQIESATNRIDISNQELTIARLQNTQAKEILTFLETKFSNTHLYEWMIHILSQNYKALMQISSNVAKLAQQALEFERQERIDLIVGDYWSIAGTPSSANLSQTQRNSGLLGAERLLTDLTRLDAYRLSTERRRLQLSKTISMAQMLPGELAILQTKGRVTFNTLLSWFDRDFPGHYLRLIKSIKISILALTPPTDGIHAMLSNSGESTVVVSDGVNFNRARAFRQVGETIALDSPYDEAGLFVLNYEDPMFLPFEGLGVETQWALELPKASNRFNFDTIVDVLLTIDYTALHNERYAEIVSDELGTTDRNDIPLNVRLLFPDEWYYFKNEAVANDTTGNLKIELSPQFLPPHYELSPAPSTQHVTVLLFGDFKGLSGDVEAQLSESVEITHTKGNDTLILTSRENTPDNAEPIKMRPLQESAQKFAFFSSRVDRGFSPPLNSSINPIGDWTISIKNIVLDTAPNSTNTLIDRIDNILMVVTTQGKVNWG